MKLILSILLIITTGYSFAQTAAAKAIEDPNLNLKERFDVMKTNSQTYGEYKVIRENILDGFWKLTIDSIAKQQAAQVASNSQLLLLKQELLATQNELKTQQASVEEIVYDSKHISVLGIPFGKNAFIILSAVIIAGLTLMVVIALARMKMVNAGMKEKTLLAHSISQEYEDYKHKALDRQTKLSRELQNERNKLLEMRGQKM